MKKKKLCGRIRKIDELSLSRTTHYNTDSKSRKTINSMSQNSLQQAQEQLQHHTPARSVGPFTAKEQMIEWMEEILNVKDESIEWGQNTIEQNREQNRIENREQNRIEQKREYNNPIQQNKTNN